MSTRDPYERVRAFLTAADLRPEFAPRGGLGLVLFPNSAASVRRVSVTPLPAVP